MFEKNFEYAMTIENGCVIAGAYEDRDELMNHDHYYRLRLNWLVQPEGKLVTKEFFGTLEQIDSLFCYISHDEWWSGFYAPTLDAWDRYRAGDHGAVHIVGPHFERLLTPVSEICRSACLIDRAQWDYQDHFGCIMCAEAKVVDASQVLLRDENRYIRTAKYWFEGLRRVHSDLGWIPHDGASKGIPYMIETAADDVATNRLMIAEAVYDDLDVAKADMRDEGKYNYHEISRELFSGC